MNIPEKKAKDFTVETMAATGMGDTYLSADACAILFGLISPSGKPNRRAFLEDLSCRPGFPAGLKIGNQTKWRKSAMLDWADNEIKAAA